MHDLTWFRRRLAAEDGFTMLAVMGMLVAVMALSAAAFAATNGDLRVSGVNGDQKTAYSAAEAGIADYLYHLNQDQNYWAQCTAVPAPTGMAKAPVNQPWDGSGADPRVWRTLPDSTSQYTIELLPAAAATCDTTKPDANMIDLTSGTFRIRATGRVRQGTGAVKRSIVATFKRRGFLDFLYFTDFEDQDPAIWYKIMACSGTTPTDQTVSPTCAASTPPLDTWARDNCGTKYWRPPFNRDSAVYSGKLGTKSDNLKCTEIQFGDTENIKGPFHTNDSILVNGAATFGRKKTDIIEVSAAAGRNPDEEPMRGTGTPKLLGTWAPGSPTMDPPPTNAALKKDATNIYNGATRIVFNSDGTMTVTNDNQTPTTKTVAQPDNGVIFVQTATAGANIGCPAGYDPYLPKVYNGTGSGCGDVSVQGVYTKNITIGADNDIVITDDLTRPASNPPNVLLGLIATNFVRVAHPSKYDSSGNGNWQGPSCTNTNTTTKDIKIESAILALTHSFTVDRYGCGLSLGNLNVTGAIAQKYRGVVGMPNGSQTSGYTKQYSYDDRLKYRSPPKFLDPVNTQWRVARQIEQAPAT
jgi:Tfp pilus assembly protein PilX